MRKVPIVSPLSRRDVDAVAEDILRRYQPGCLAAPEPFDLERHWDRIAYDFGFEYEIRDLDPGVEGLTDLRGKRVIIPEEVHDRMCTGDGRARFTVSHELGHAVLHGKLAAGVMVNRGELALARRKDIPAFRDPEWQANEFAAALLMPASIVRAIAEKASQPALAVSKALRVSIPAADYRLRNLGVGK